jgi:hypothetical protein
MHHWHLFSLFSFSFSLSPSLPSLSLLSNLLLRWAGAEGLGAAGRMLYLQALNPQTLSAATCITPASHRRIHHFGIRLPQVIHHQFPDFPPSFLPLTYIHVCIRKQQWIDEDGDQCCLSSDAELGEAVFSCASRRTTLSLMVTVPGETPAQCQAYADASDIEVSPLDCSSARQTLSCLIRAAIRRHILPTTTTRKHKQTHEHEHNATFLLLLMGSDAG